MNRAQAQLRKLIRSPVSLVRFQTTGQLPEVTPVDSPLIRLLNQIAPRDRVNVLGVTIDERLGYRGRATFPNLAQAYQWIKPGEYDDGTFHPALSRQIPGFSKQLSLDDLAECCTRFPDRLFTYYSSRLYPGHNI